MGQVRETTTIQIHPKALPKQVYVSQYDFGSRLVFDFVTVSGGAFYEELDEYTVKIQGKKPSGMGFTVAFDSEWDNSVVITKDMTDEAGIIPVEIVFTSNDGTELIGSANFELIVEASPHPAGTIDGSEEARDLLARLERAVEQTQEAADNATQAVADAQRALQDVQAQVTIDDVNPSLTTAFSGTKTDSLVKAVEDRVGAVEQQADALEAGVESLNTEMNGVTSRVSSLETEVGNSDISAIGDGTVTGAVSSLYDRLYGIHFRYVTRQITIAAGSYTNPTFVTLDLSPELGDTGTIIAADVYLGPNKLPYISNGAVRTQIYQVTGRSIILANTTSDAWTNYTLYAFVAISKPLS